MIAVEQPIEAGDQLLVAPPSDLQVADATTIVDSPRDKSSRILTMGRGYGYREANWQIGRSAERVGVQVKQFVPGDRWAAWRKSQARIQANEEKKRLRSSSKKGGKSKKEAKRGR